MKKNAMAKAWKIYFLAIKKFLSKHFCQTHVKYLVIGHVFSLLIQTNWRKLYEEGQVKKKI